MKRIVRISSLSSMVFQPPWFCGAMVLSQKLALKKLTTVNRCCMQQQLTGGEGFDREALVLCRRKKRLSSFHSHFISSSKDTLNVGDDKKENVISDQKSSKNNPTNQINEGDTTQNTVKLARSKTIGTNRTNGIKKRAFIKNTVNQDDMGRVNDITDSKSIRHNPTNMNKKQNLIHQLVDTGEAVQVAMKELRDTTAKVPDSLHPTLAVDCEGVRLSRNGSLTLITISTPSKTFIFDVLQLGHTLFDAGLRNILENPSVLKLTFDCRKDSDALWHLYKVKLDGVMDIQLLHAMTLIDNPTDVFSLKKYSDLLRFSEQFAEMKRVDEEVWKLCDDRPLPRELIDYCIADTKPMFHMYRYLKGKLRNPDWFLILQKASQIYADYYRSLDVWSSEEMGYDNNGFLLIPLLMFLRGEVPGLLGRPSEGVERCIGCHRYVLEKYMEPTACYCLVCQKIMLKILERDI